MPTRAPSAANMSAAARPMPAAPPAISTPRSVKRRRASNEFTDAPLWTIGMDSSPIESRTQALGPWYRTWRSVSFTAYRRAHQLPAVIHDERQFLARPRFVSVHELREERLVTGQRASARLLGLPGAEWQEHRGHGVANAIPDPRIGARVGKRKMEGGESSSQCRPTFRGLDFHERVAHELEI